MNLAMVDKIAKAVLYEGYMLYPYRPSSVKNQQRWNFGVLSPKSYSDAQKGSEAWTMQTECLVEGSELTRIEVRVRFLQLVARSVGEFTKPAGDLLPGDVPGFRPVERLELNGHIYQPWQEAIERELSLPVYNVEALSHRLVSDDFSFSAEKQFEYLRDGCERVDGVIVRERSAICGAIEVGSERVDEGTFKVSVVIQQYDTLSRHERCQPRRRVAEFHGFRSYRARDTEWWFYLFARASGADERVGRELQEHWDLAGSGRRGRAMRHRTLVADYSLRLSRRSLRKAPVTCSTEPRSTKFSPCAS